MVSLEIFIGFRERPSGLEEFLNEHGLARVRALPNTYRGRSGLTAEFFADIATAGHDEDGDGDPDWEFCGMVSELRLALDPSGSDKELYALQEDLLRRYAGSESYEHDFGYVAADDL